MVRTYKQITERNNIIEVAVAAAISDVLEGRLSIRKAADKYNLKHATLQHRVISRIYTDTPEKRRLEELQSSKHEAALKKEQRKRATDLKNAKKLLGLEAVKPIQKARKKCKKAMESDSSHCSVEVILQESFDSEEIFSSEDEIFNIAAPLASDIKEGDFIIAKIMNLEKKQPFKNYVAKIVSKYEANDFNVCFLKRTPTGTFVFPDVRDEASVNISHIILKPPEPVVKKGTNRTA